jgi:serralysin
MGGNTAGRRHSTFGEDAIAATASGRQAVKFVPSTGSDFIDGVISGSAWKGASISYSFPNSRNDYSYAGERGNHFGTVSRKIEHAAEFILDTAYGGKANDGFAVEGFTNLTVKHGSDTGATIRYAESHSADPTAYAYFPDTTTRGGDVWFGTQANYSNSVQGNYEFATVIHETGHALGLKHGHEVGNGNPAIPHQWDSLEYSVMTYRSYVDGPVSGYTNENFGYPQTYMMADIAALQQMYGANFHVNSGSTTYAWKPNSANTWVNGKVAIDGTGDNIFATIWDGGGKHDKYDLHAYSANLTIDLRPGAFSVFKHSQLADLDTSPSKNHIARGNIFNALQYGGADDKRSLIEDAVGGSGSDLIWGNISSNHLVGNGGNDELAGWKGNDLLSGGGGKDLFIFKRGWDHDTIADFSGHDRIDVRNFKFDKFTELMSRATDDHGDVRFSFGGGDVLVLDGVHKAELHSNDFLFLA